MHYPLNVRKNNKATNMNTGNALGEVKNKQTNRIKSTTTSTNKQTNNNNKILHIHVLRTSNKLKRKEKKKYTSLLIKRKSWKTTTDANSSHAIF